jgi:hypothetical protein
MTIGINFRIYLKKDSTQKGTVKEITTQSNKTKTFRIVWDDANFQGCQIETNVFKSSEIMELYKLKTLSENERNLLILERNRIVENNLKIMWSNKPPDQAHKVLAVDIINSVEENLKLETTNTNNNTKFSDDMVPSVGSLLANFPTTIIQPPYKMNRFCKHNNTQNPRISASLRQYYCDDSNDDDGDSDGDSHDDDDEIYSPQFINITKGQMRYFVRLFTFKALYRDNLLHRLNQSFEYNNNTTNNDDESTTNTDNTSGYDALEAINNILKLSLEEGDTSSND